MIALVQIPFAPPRGSTIAGEVDRLYLFTMGGCLAAAALVATLVLVFAIRYRRRPGAPPPRQVRGHLGLEIGWTVVPAILWLGLFAWGAVLYARAYAEPHEPGVEIHVLARQWMWKFMHPGGRAEINELHLPRGVPVRLVLASQDVVHSFYVPAFRTKRDVLPGRWIVLGVEATTLGEHHLFCAEYCGTEHARMSGRVIVMDPGEYQHWLEAGARDVALADRGAELWRTLGCQACHAGPTRQGPWLGGLIGRTVRLQGGETIVADLHYLRESILDPQARLVEGHAGVMPAYAGIVGEEDLLALLAFIRSLGRWDPAQQEAPR